MGMVDSILSENKDKWLESMMWVLVIKYQVLYYTVTVYYGHSQLCPSKLISINLSKTKTYIDNEQMTSKYFYITPHFSSNVQ